MKPILFNTDMVKAIFDGRKTQTRRVVKWEPYHDGEKINCTFSGMHLGYHCTSVPDSGYVLYSRGRGGVWEQRTKPAHCPYGKTGDILWVRETWQKLDSLMALDIAHGNYAYVYKASENGEAWARETDGWTWRPSIHMPREAARLFLRVKSVRVERLQDISENDVRLEGFRDSFDPLTDTFYPSGYHFVEAWDGIYAKRGFGWETNPWVWVIEFERVAGDEIDG